MTDILDDLNPSQREAVMYTDGPLFVFAGPGTGKTRVTTSKLAYLLKEKGYRPEEVLALTFSNRAAQEMEDRVRKLLPGVSGLQISTFHSFCLEVLQDSILELGIDISKGVFKKEYQQAFFLDNMDKFGFQTIKIPARPAELARLLQDTIARLKQENIPLERLEAYLATKKGTEDPFPAELADVVRAYKALEDFKKANGFLDFGDMQLLALRLLEGRPDVLERYHRRLKYLVVDEFQDTDFIQLRMLFKLAPEGNLTVVGDDDQSIYRFRGAYLTNIHEFDEHFDRIGKKPRRMVLDLNYRCSGNIQALATRLIRNNPERADKEIRTDKAAGLPVQIGGYANDEQQAADIARIIQKRRKEGLSWDAMAVLVRRRVDSGPITEAMERAGIPFELLSSREYFKEPIVRAVIAYLRFLEDPNLNQTALGQLLLRPVHGILPGEVQKLARYARDGGRTLWDALGALEGPKEDTSLFKRFKEEMDRLFKARGEKGLLELVRLVLFGRDLFRVEIARKDLNNIRLLNRFLQLSKEFTEIFPEAGLKDFLSHLRALQDIGLEDEGLEPAAGKVHLLTIHGSKGMEFPVVLIPCLNQDRIPSRFQRYKIEIPQGLADGIPPKGTPEELQLQEERRLLYVGMSRAKDGLYLGHCKRYGSNVRDTPVSVFLEEMKAGEGGFEERQVEPCPEELAEPTADAERALNRYLATSISRGAWQEALDAVTAMAAREGGSASGLSVNKELKLEEVLGRLEILEKAPQEAHSREAEYSPSKLRTYEDCPKKYWFQHVMGIPGEVRPYFELGTVTHSVIEAVSRKMQEGKAVSEAEALETLDRLWVPSKYEYKEKEKEDRAAAEEMVRTFLAHQSRKKGKIVAVEMKMDFDLEGRRIRGKVDRVDDTGKVLEVIDYKSGKTESSKPALRKDFQMGLYKIGVEKTFGKPVGATGHWYLRSDKEWMVELTAQEVEEIRKRALEIIKRIEMGEFEAVPEYQVCQFCDYKELCGEEK